MRLVTLLLLYELIMPAAGATTGATAAATAAAAATTVATTVATAASSVCFCLPLPFIEADIAFIIEVVNKALLMNYFLAFLAGETA
jgi:hypothetical protein